MTIIQRHLRAVSFGLACGVAILLAVELFPQRLLDRFFEQQVEAKAIAVWKRQAVDAGYGDCRANMMRCFNKVVVWPVTHRSDGVSYWGSKVSEPIRWANPRQVPQIGGPSNMFQAIARVVGFDPDAVILLYIGTTDAQYGGTTWNAKFGLRSSDSNGTGAMKRFGTFENYSAAAPAAK